MRIILEMYDSRIIYESDKDDYKANELKEIFSRMLVQATYPPGVIEPAEGGHWECEYKEDE